jgi:hypothetical protein
MTPPEPTLIRSVAAEARAIISSGAALAMLGELWCSAYQIRAKPSASPRCAAATELWSACEAGTPSSTSERSRTERGKGTGGSLAREWL